MIGAEEYADQQLNPLSIAWRKSRPGLMVVGIISIFINLLRFATPIYVLQILNRVISSGSIETLVMLTIITLIAVIIGSILVIIRRKLLIAWGNWMMRFFGPPLFVAGLQDTSYQKSKISGGQKDVKTLRSFVAGDGLSAWIDVIWAPAFIAVTFLIAPLLGYIALAGCILVLILGALGEYLSRDSRNSAYSSGRDAQEWIDTTERHRETVESLNITRNFASRWCNSAFARQDEGTRAQMVRVYIAVFIHTVARFVRVAIFGTGIWLVLSHELTIGAVIAASVLARTAFSMVRNATFKWRETVAAKNAYGRVKDALQKITSTPISVPTEEQAVPLIIDGASYRYNGETQMVFRDVSLTVHPGEVLFVIGASATGKTTFVRMSSGLFSPRWGQVRLGDMDVVRLQRSGIRRGIGALLQETTLFNGTIRENIAGMLEGEIEEVIRAAKLAGIHDKIMSFPRGYDMEIVENEPRFSAGQRKTIALARAFYGRPALIILDEPFPHLDKATRSVLFKSIAQLKAENTILVITSQFRSDSKYADKVLFFEETKFKVLETPAQLEDFRTGKRIRRKRAHHSPHPNP